MHLVGVEGAHKWEESQLTRTPWRVSMPNHCLLLTGSKVATVRNLQPVTVVSIAMLTGSLH